MRGRYRQEIVAVCAITSKTLVNRRSSKVVNIASTKMMRKNGRDAQFSQRPADCSGRAARTSLGASVTLRTARRRKMAGKNPGHVSLKNGCWGSRLAGDGLAECGLRRGQPRDRHAVGRAGDVIQSDLVAERDGGGIAAMLAANADLETRAGLASARNADLHQLADAVAIDRDERIDLQDSLGDIGAEESGGVVAADAVSRLRQIVGAEREELRRLGDVAGHQAGARQFDHGADL